MEKRDIKDFTLEGLEKVITELGSPPYRAKQIFSWIYKKGIADFNEMSNIPDSLKGSLNRDYCIGTLGLSRHLKSAGGAEKILFKLGDGNFIETVLISANSRKTICLSTQLGCKFACRFCASGSMGFVRDLTPSEITGQILFLQRNLKYKITNHVFMGMGEPLDNYENVSKSIMIMNTPEGMNIGARRITVSTCGIIPGMEKLKNLGLQVNLSISLHASNDRLRNELMPINRRYPLEELIKACEGFINKAGRIITLEYILIKGKNDSLKDADGIAIIAKRLKAKVNLIPCSQVPGLNFQSTPRKGIELFVRKLISKGVNVTLRESKGEDINAACGQLAGYPESKNLLASARE